MLKNIRYHSEMGKDGKLMFVIQAIVYPSTACALKIPVSELSVSYFMLAYRF